jgi:hypothetical protein
MELVEYSSDELRSVDKEMLNAEITQLEEDIGKAKPNLNVLAEYRRREAEFLDRARDMESVTSQRDAAKKRYDDLRKVRLDEFMAGFSAISSKLKEMYQVSRTPRACCHTDAKMITMGGNAEIELIDSMDPFSEGASRRQSPLTFKVSSCPSCHRKSRGERLPTCREEKKRSHRSLSSSRCTYSSRRPCTLWTKSTRRWTSRMSRLSQITSSPRRKLRNCEDRGL